MPTSLQSMWHCTHFFAAYRLQGMYEKIKAAKSIAVIGGGPTGSELAGEFITDYPDKKVTLIHSGGRLLPDLDPSLSKEAASYFKKLGCEVVLNDRVLEVEEGAAVVTKSGNRYAAELVFWCTGAKMNTEFMKEELSDSLTPDGQIKVDTSLRVVGTRNMFALGDCAAIEGACGDRLQCTL